MVEKPHFLSHSFVVEGQTALFTFEGPLSFSLATYGSKHGSHYGSLYCCCLYIYGSMVGGMAHWLDVSLGGEISHIVCIACSNGSMREYLATIEKHLFPIEVSHMID